MLSLFHISTNSFPIFQLLYEPPLILLLSHLVITMNVSVTIDFSPRRLYIGAITAFSVISSRRSLTLADMSTLQYYVISTLSEKRSIRNGRWQV